VKYVIVKNYGEREAKLTRPSTKVQAVNSFTRFRRIGITDIYIKSTNKKNPIVIEESAEELQKAKRDFERINGC
tara:strand:+ start:280 stop:501 length:222 start_codon:yes stop_codon:yes gene_type:complete